MVKTPKYPIIIFDKCSKGVNKVIMNSMNTTNIPYLIEPKIRNFLYHSLQKCHEYKTYYFSYVFNIVVFLSFVIIVGLILYYSRKNKLTPYEQEQKTLNDQKYILSKIRFYQEQQKEISKSSSSITNLPIL